MLLALTGHKNTFTNETTALLLVIGHEGTHHLMHITVLFGKNSAGANHRAKWQTLAHANKPVVETMCCSYPKDRLVNNN